LVVAALTTTTLPATPLLVLAQVVYGFGGPAEVAAALTAGAELLTSTAVAFSVRAAGGAALLVIAVVQARRGRRTLPELMAAFGVAGIMIAAAVLFDVPLLWSPDALAAIGAALAIAVLLVALGRRQLTAPRATSVLVALLVSALF